MYELSSSKKGLIPLEKNDFSSINLTEKILKIFCSTVLESLAKMLTIMTKKKVLFLL